MAGTSFLKYIIVNLLSVSLLLTPVFPAEGEAVRAFSSGSYPYQVYEQTAEADHLTVSRRTYDFDGVKIIMMRARPQDGVKYGSAVNFYSDAASGTLWAKECDGSWGENPLRPGIYIAENLIIEEDERTVFISLPAVYEEKGFSVVQKKNDLQGFLEIKESKTGYSLSVAGLAAPSGHFTDCTVMIFDKDRPDLNKENCLTLWDKYTEGTTAKWLCDGYYREAPAEYTPTCPNGYYRCSAAFLINVMASQIGLLPEAPYITLACWDTVMQNQNPSGYWQTDAISDWLNGSFGIGAGFFDTRFNTDLAETGYLIYSRLKTLPCKDIMSRYYQYFYVYCLNNHRETENGGWLVYDYSGPGQRAKTHISLNHMAAECLALYHMAEIRDDANLKRTADRLLTAIEDTGAGWLAPAGDYYYAMSAEGEYLTERKDYATLTYDDLLTLQRYLISSGREASPAINELLASKKKWMDARGITDYLK